MSKIQAPGLSVTDLVASAAGPLGVREKLVTQLLIRAVVGIARRAADLVARAARGGLRAATLVAAIRALLAAAGAAAHRILHAAVLSALLRIGAAAGRRASGQHGDARGQEGF